ncbi:hypothetical protein QAD02_015878 [Eretmocerus hayati]|uniref:Uncharacterized protein n=1 Tax=Eretmocerus hayati TaxID=131215 RepID=A0ACC2P9G9_9HYME|nr:hypothetical protein QAD02_015878 [Eretmocerus hayati]
MACASAASSVDGIKPFFGTKYSYSSQEGSFSDVLDNVGVGFFTRKSAALASPTLSLTESEGKPGYYVLHTKSTFKSYDVEFKPDEEFDYHTADGRDVKYFVKFEGNKMIETQKNKDDGRTLHIERIFSKDEMKVNMKAGDAFSNRIYKAEN